MVITVNETYNGQPQYFSDFILNMEKKYDLSTDQTSRLMMDFVAAVCLFFKKK